MNILWVSFLYLVFKVSPLGATPHPDCIPPAFQAQCIAAKCNATGFTNCESLANPYPGGDQCCDENTLMELKMDAGGRRKKRQAVDFDAVPFAKWKSPITLYINIPNAPGTPYIQNIMAAVSQFEMATCLEFTYSDTLPTTDHIAFISHTEGCASFVGKSNKTSSPIVGDAACFSNSGNVLKLLAQTLGLWHQTQRTDRDDYVFIQQSSLPDSNKADFAKVNSAFITNFGMSYDYSSIVQYPAKVFSTNGDVTIIPLSPEYILTMGQRVELSYQDVKILNTLYCSGECAGVELDCMNGGYTDPKNCTKCLCPEGFGGDKCALGVTQKTVMVSGDCGGELEATSTNASITSPGYVTGDYPPNVDCQWHIKAPGGKVELKFDGDFKVYADELSVCQQWVEVRYGKLLNETGARFCGDFVPTDAIVSTTSSVLVIFKSNNVGKTLGPQKGFKLNYKLVDADACLSAPCQNAGECLNINDQYKCRCANGYAGQNCEFNLNTTQNQCDFNPCFNNGTCSQINSTTFSCECLEGFSGDRCQNAFCGGCDTYAGPSQCNEKQCKVGYNPPINCTRTNRFYSCGWRGRGCRIIEYNTSYPCVRETFCCDYAWEVNRSCARLGWTDWSGCSSRCGGGTMMRYFYGVKDNDYKILKRESKDCNMDACPPRKCYWYYRWAGYC